MTNCLNLTLIDLPNGVSKETVLAEIIEDCKQTPDVELGNDGKIDFNIASERDLISFNCLDEPLIKKIISYRERHGAFVNFRDLTRLFGVKRENLNALSEKAYISKHIMNRFKIEQAMDLV